MSEFPTIESLLQQGSRSGIDYNRLLRTLLEYCKATIPIQLGSPTSFLPSDTEFSITIPKGTPPGTQFRLEIEPPDPNLYLMDIVVLKITPDAELLINGTVTGYDGRTSYLFANDLDGDVITGEQIYDVEKTWGRMLCSKLVIIITTKVTTTADRTVTLKISGGLVAKAAALT